MSTKEKIKKPVKQVVPEKKKDSDKGVAVSYDSGKPIKAFWRKKKKKKKEDGDNYSESGLV